MSLGLSLRGRNSLLRGRNSLLTGRNSLLRGRNSLLGVGIHCAPARGLGRTRCPWACRHAKQS
eukprot:1188222-Prorocentrum_minimum.AAC.7